jgi:hypothetical protein
MLPFDQTPLDYLSQRFGLNETQIRCEMIEPLKLYFYYNQHFVYQESRS